MAEEFRFVIENPQQYNLDGENTYEVTDHYFARTQRLRMEQSDSGRWPYTYIYALPGSIHKKSWSLLQRKAESMKERRPVILTVHKQGLGTLSIDGMKGYVEHIIARRNGQVIADEVQVEFELPPQYRHSLEEKLRPKAVIEEGLFDYLAALFPS